jgi:plasmid maintenance system antidote protein VapI
VPGGRPPREEHEAYPELAEMADWFKRAIGERGHSSVRAFVQQHTLDKNKIYELVRGRVLLSLESTRHLAQLLGRDPAEVEPLWLRAREATDLRLMAEDEQQRPRVAAWTQIPRPELALRNVLDALTEAVEQLPYRLLGVAPPRLSTVYVRQMLRSETAGTVEDQDKHIASDSERSDRGEPFGAEASVSVLEALDRSEHLLITGEPGAGKSTLGHNLVSRLARIWLRQESAASPPLSEPVVPLRVSARALVGEGAWSTILAEALRQALGPYLVTEPSPQMFNTRTHGARWLIVVDGLDELLDRSARTSVIRTLARHARPGGDYRLVITTRPLPAQELAPLRSASISLCRVQPFEQEELKLFAKRWFLAQDPITAEERAADFLRQVEDSRLKDLVRNPLLATIAAVASTREPERQLPTTRVDLYQRFYDYLVTDEEASGRSTPTELRRFGHVHADRHRLAEWIYSRRTQIIDVLARERMTTEASLTETARSWVRDNKPPQVQLPPGWEEDLDRLLIDTGMFVYERSGIRFLHHTFAEFLAARSYAQEIPPDFPDLEEWIDRGLKPAQRNFVLLTMVLWGRVPGNDPALILRSLVQSSQERIMLAGRLLAESDQVEHQAARQVMDRLFDIALGNARHGCYADIYGRYGSSIRRLEDRLRLTDNSMNVISLLIGNAYAASRLREIADSAGLDFPMRIIAVATLRDVSTNDQTLERLKALVPSAVTDFDFALVATGLIEFDSNRSKEARSILVRLANDPQASAECLAEVAPSLVDIGEIGEAVKAARRVVCDDQANQEELRSAIKLLFDNSGQEEHFALSEELAELFDERGSQDQVDVARQMIEAGFPGQASRLAAKVICNPASRSSDISAASGMWLSNGELGSFHELLEMLRKRSDLEDGARVGVAEELAKAGHAAEACRLAEEVIGDTTAEGYATGRAVTLWFAVAEGRSLDHLLGILGGRVSLDSWVRAEVADALATAGHLTAAVEFASAVLSDPHADAYDMRKAAEVCLRAGGMASQDVHALVEQGRPATPQGRVAAARALAGLHNTERATQISLEVLSSSLGGRATLQDAVDVLVLANGVAAAEPVLAALASRPAASALHFYAADRLATAGALSVAVNLWCDMLVFTAVSPVDSIGILSRLVQTGHRDRALAALRDALAVTGMRAPERARLKSLLTWATLCGESTDETPGCPQTTGSVEPDAR